MSQIDPFSTSMRNCCKWSLLNTVDVWASPRPTEIVCKGEAGHLIYNQVPRWKQHSQPCYDVSNRLVLIEQLLHYVGF